MGLLDGLFAPDTDGPNPAMFKMGSLGETSGEDVPIYDDYTGTVPTRRAKKGSEVLDADLNKFRETHPITPEMAAAAAPPMLQAPGAPQQNPSGLPAPPLAPGQPFSAPGRPVSALPAGNGTIDPRPPAGGTMPGMLGSELGGPYGAVPAASAAPAAPGGPVPMPVPDPRKTSPDVTASPPQRATDMSSQGRVGSPAEGAIDMTDAPIGMLSKVWDGIKNNSNLLMGMGAGMMGAPSWATGMGRGFAGAQAGAQADYKQNLAGSSQQQLYTALVQAGVPRQQAIAATTNPKLAETLLASYIGDRKREIKVVKDSLGNERIVSVNPYMSQEELDRANGEGGGGATTVGGGGPDASGLARMPIELDPTTGRDEKFAEAFKKADPVNYASTENMLNGNMAGTGRNLQQLMKYASRIDPTFNQATYGARQNLYKSYYGGGEGYKGVRAANTAVQHGVDLQKDIEELHNFTAMPGFLNPTTGAIAKQFSERYQNALKNFKADKEVYSHELETALTGKSTVTGTKQLADLFDENAAPGANKSALHTTLRDLSQRIEEHENAYNRVMSGEGGPAAAPPASGVAGPKKISWSVVQ
jgi:hypothetical protein